MRITAHRVPTIIWTTANHDTLAFAMIETRDAYDALDAILDVRGIDGVFVGPGGFLHCVE